jgi:hypothetical protein
MRAASIERDTGSLVAAPDRAATADELIGLDHQHERWRQDTGLATSIAAPPDDRLRTVHRTPLPSKAMVAPFRTLYRGADRFSVMVSIML